MKLTPIQQRVAQHYCGGDMMWVTDTDQLKECGDGLFSFLIHEAGDAGDVEEFRRMLETAGDQLRSLKGELG